MQIFNRHVSQILFTSLINGGARLLQLVQKRIGKTEHIQLALKLGGGVGAPVPCPGENLVINFDHSQSILTACC